MSTTQECISLSRPPTPTSCKEPEQPCDKCTKLILYTVICTLIGAGIFILVKSPFDPVFKVQSATVSELNATASELTGRWSITLVAHNPDINSYRVSLTDLHASVLYRDHIRFTLHNRFMIGQTPLRPFVMNKSTDTLVTIELAAVSLPVSDEVMGKQMYDDRSRGFMVFPVTVSGSYRHEKALFSKYRCFLVECDFVYFGFSQNGTATLMEPTWCAFYSRMIGC